MITIPLADRETAVYRLFNATKSLLYVGISWDPDTRMKDHEAKKAWWSDVEHMAIAWYRNRSSAMRREAWAIATEVPLHNTKRPNPNRYDFSGLEDEIVSLPGLNVREASSYLKLPPAWLTEQVASDGVPYSRSGSEIWFSEHDIEAIKALRQEQLLDAMRATWAAMPMHRDSAAYAA